MIFTWYPKVFQRIPWNDWLCCDWQHEDSSWYQLLCDSVWLQSSWTVCLTLWWKQTLSNVSRSSVIICFSANLTISNTPLRDTHTTLFILLTSIHTHANERDRKRKLLWISYAELCFLKRCRRAWCYITTAAVSIEILHAQSLMWSIVALQIS